MAHDREADTGAHPGPAGRRRPDTVGELGQVTDEDQVPGPPGTPGEADTLGEGGGERDLAEFVTGGAGLDLELQHVVDRVDLPVRPVSPVERRTHRVQGRTKCSLRVLRRADLGDDRGDRHPVVGDLAKLGGGDRAAAGALGDPGDRRELLLARVVQVERGGRVVLQHPHHLGALDHRQHQAGCHPRFQRGLTPPAVAALGHRLGVGELTGPVRLADQSGVGRQRPTRHDRLDLGDQPTGLVHQGQLPAGRDPDRAVAEAVRLDRAGDRDPPRVRLVDRGIQGEHQFLERFHIARDGPRERGPVLPGTEPPHAATPSPDRTVTIPIGTFAKRCSGKLRAGSDIPFRAR